MKINKKTKIMKICRCKDKEIAITVEGEQLERVEEFQYLGSTMTADERSSSEIMKRVAMGKEAFNSR